MTLTEPSATSEAAPAVPPTVAIFNLWLGSVVAQMMRTVTDHGIPDLLLERPRTTAELAEAADLHAPSLHRLLRATTGVGLLASGPDGWRLTPLGQALAEIGGGPGWAYDATYQLSRTVATGTTGMELAYGQTVFEYLAERPDEAAAFARSQALINAGEPRAVVDAYDFAGIGVLVDVGGGNGTFLAEVLQRHPRLHGVLFDLPETIAQITPELTRFEDRCEAVGGDFFEAVPPDADAYLLSHVVHDWDEQRCLAMLRNVRSAIAPDGRLLIVEMVMPPGDEPHPAKLLDIVMLILSGGTERTESEYGELLAKAGFRLARVIPTRSPVSVLEARPV
jgi:O-methyltransferase domain